MKNLLLASILATTFSTGAATAEALRVAISADYPPWESVDASGEMIGFDIDVTNEICQRIEAECELVNQGFDGLLPALITGQYDLVVSAISITDERKEKISFSNAYAQAPASFGGINVDPDAVGSVDALQEFLSGKTIGIQLSSTFEVMMANHFADVDVKTYERADQITADLKTGRLDLALFEFSAWDEFKANDKDANYGLVGPSLTYADFQELGEGLGVGLQIDATDLKARVDAAVAAMLEDGTITSLSDKWFGYDVSP